MSKLTARGKNRIKAKNFALAKKRYPIHDISHARNALARVSQHGTASEKKRVKTAVYKKFPSLKKKRKK
jgi:hypothetical protein